MAIHKYWSSACPKCPIRSASTTSDYRRLARWEHEAVIERMQRRLDRMPEAGRLRRQTVEHAFGTLKSWMGATHFLTKTLPRVRTEMSLQVLAYNMKRVIQILGVQRLESSGLVVRCYLPSNRLGRVITQPRSVSDLSVASQGVKPRGFTPVPQTTFSVANQGVQPSLFIPFQ
jgi:hypothetical protein